MESECVLWLGSIRPDGYGRRKLNGTSMGAHRAAWIETNGPIPDGLVVRHKCDNRPCVNLEHLELGTQMDNMLDCSKRRTFKSTLTEENVTEIRTSNCMQRELAEKFGVSEATISRIRNHKRWK